MKTAFLFLIFFSTTTFGGTWINGGTKAQEGDEIARKTVALIGELNDGRKILCSGSIIDEDLVLTAAHCTYDDQGNPLKEITLSFGIDIRNAKATVVAKNFVAHPNYRSWFVDANDIALVHFEGGVPSGFEVAKILPENFSIKAGDEAILAGFGQGGPTGNLNFLAVDVMNPDFGQTEIRYRQTEDKGACFGDSGGPSFFRDGNDLFVGGVANRVGTRDCGNWVIYAKPTAHLEWLQEAANDLRQP